MLTIGSLFSGIGGLELGLERAGLGPVLWQVEVDPYARQVLARHWPSVARHGDVRTVGGGVLQAVDLICGGFPCQDISLAGKGAGLDGARSGLWYEYLRIVRELRPRYVVVENVAALLARGLDVVLGGLAESGYDAEWDCIPAVAVGAPHRRDRLFIVAQRAADAERDTVRIEPGRQRGAGGTEGAAEPRHDGGEGIAPDSDGGRQPRNAERDGEQRRGLDGELGVDTVGRGVGWTSADFDASRFGAGVADLRPRQRDIEGRSGVGTPADAGHRHPPNGRQGRPAPRHAERSDPWGGGDWSTAPSAVHRVDDVVPHRVDRLRGLGNAVVPQVAEWIGHRLLASMDAP